MSFISALLGLIIGFYLGVLVVCLCVMSRD